MRVSRIDEGMVPHPRECRCGRLAVDGIERDDPVDAGESNK